MFWNHDLNRLSHAYQRIALFCKTVRPLNPSSCEWAGSQVARSWTGRKLHSRASEIVRSFEPHMPQWLHAQQGRLVRRTECKLSYVLTRVGKLAEAVSEVYVRFPEQNLTVRRSSVLQGRVVSCLASPVAGGCCARHSSMTTSSWQAAKTVASWPGMYGAEAWPPALTGHMQPGSVAWWCSQRVSAFGCIPACCRRG